RYGRRAIDVAAYVGGDAGLAEPVVAGEPEMFAEFAYQRDHEMAVRPADFLLRRTRLAMYYPDLLPSPEISERPASAPPPWTPWPGWRCSGASSPRASPRRAPPGRPSPAGPAPRGAAPAGLPAWRLRPSGESRRRSAGTAARCR